MKILIWCNAIFDMFSLLFVLFIAVKTVKINLIAYADFFYYLTYRGKLKKKWRATFLKTNLPKRNYGMDFRCSGNNGNMMCICIWDDL